MVKTTIYLPEELKRALERVAAEENRPEAEIIREAIRSRVESRRPRPKLPLTGRALGDPTAAMRVGGILRGFGHDR